MRISTECPINFRLMLSDFRRSGKREELQACSPEKLAKILNLSYITQQRGVNMDIKNLSRREWFLILIDADSQPKLKIFSLACSLAHLCYFLWMGFSFFWCILGPILFLSGELLGCLYFPTRRLIWNEIKNVEKFSLGVKGKPSEPEEELTIIKVNLFSVLLEDVNGKRFSVPKRFFSSGGPIYKNFGTLSWPSKKEEQVVFHYSSPYRTAFVLTAFLFLFCFAYWAWNEKSCNFLGLGAFFLTSLAGAYWFSVLIKHYIVERFFNSKPRTSKVLSKAVFLLLKARVFIGFVGSSYTTFLIFRKFNLI